MTCHPCANRDAPDAVCRLLRHALTYARNGRPVFPCRPNKTPLTPHGCKDATTDRNRLVEWWTGTPGAMIGLRTGEVSGIVVVDLDLDEGKGLDGITAFNALVPAETAPIATRTHRTPRGGRHLLFAWPGVPVRNSVGQIARGVDVRGDSGYIIAPPSVSTAGQYSIETDMEPQPLPEWLRAHLLPDTDTNQDTPPVTETTEKTETIETSEAILSAVSVTLEDVLRDTQPQRPGQRNGCLLNLARGLRFNLKLADKPLQELKPIVRHWWQVALPNIATKDFDTTWADFLHAWPLARHGLGDVLADAWHTCQSTDLPAEAAGYDSQPVRALVALCATLGKQSTDGRFFLSTHAAGRLLKEHSMQVSRWLRMLAADGLVEVVKIGTERRATRYRWTGGHATPRKQEGAP